ncbi:MAG TPA: hypothetical protein VF595_04230 [Tepidisphaeraceae bacterium]|jgi:hypothetical protein
MTGSFAYSFDRDTYYGNYPTREAALAAAGRALKSRADQPDGIYVGQWSLPDPQTDGHAEGVLLAMCDRFAQATGDTGYLARVSEQQAAALDTALQTTLTEWLAKNGLTPKATRVHAVSQYPVPNVHHVDVPLEERETSLIGEA